MTRLHNLAAEHGLGCADGIHSYRQGVCKYCEQESPDRVRAQRDALADALRNVLSVWQRCNDYGSDLSYMEEPVSAAEVALAQLDATR